MDLKRLINTLHSLERKVLPVLENNSKLGDIIKASELSEVEVVRTIQWLGNKGIVNVETKESEIGILTDKTKSLPERAVLNNLSERNIDLEELKNKTKLSLNEINACIGLLKRKGAIDIIKEKQLKIRLNKNGLKLLEKKTPEEELFNRLLSGSVIIVLLNDEEKFAFGELRKRGLATIEIVKEKTVNLTDLGKKLVKEKIETDIIENVTASVIRDRLWEKKRLRGYDIKANVPSIQRGKRHFVDQSIEYIKRIWLDLGFEEMEGGICQTSFWCLDSLFIPQDHPARDMQDTFFVGKNGAVLSGKLPQKFPEIIKKVHENGWTTGSNGWGGKWKPEIAKEVLLRTHTTALSALTLAKLSKEDLPKKFFKVGVVYRNEALDWKHLFEFHHIDGIVVDPNANFRHLIGYLKEFYKKMGFDKIRLKPSFYPYTSPSMDIEVWNPIKGEWVETGGSGIFRPEVTKALLGFECPVLAWGQGLERILIEYYKIKDLRNLYDNDLSRLRGIKEFMK